MPAYEKTCVINKAQETQSRQNKKNKKTPAKSYGTVKLAQDVHAPWVVFSIQEEGQPPKAPRRMETQKCQVWVEKFIPDCEKVYSCHEAGPTSFALHRKLADLGAENIVAVPTEEREQKRVLTRQRQQLQEERLSLASQGRSLVLSQGIA
ncbi:MAG: hypothetical protein FJ403_17760, partial [Verrucomicrobia bacterium]|nr:hypothetical protein [Verrucomicrobiota bacterium]